MGLPAPARRVVRGGSWDGSENNARARYRNYNAPANRNNNLGLRVVRPSHIIIPLLWRSQGRSSFWLLRACPPAWPVWGTLPALVADYGLQPEAKV